MKEIQKLRELASNYGFTDEISCNYEFLIHFEAYCRRILLIDIKIYNQENFFQQLATRLLAELEAIEVNF